MDGMTGRIVFIRDICLTTSDKLFNLCTHCLAVCRLSLDMTDRARGRYKTRLAGLRLKVNWVASGVAQRFFLIGVA